MNFPDLPHLQQLQRDLWKWPKSRAALMVGAGFSLNASPLAGVTSRFPTWRELVRAMFDQLHPPMPGEANSDKSAREEKFNRASPLRIASEYEVALGRDKLNRVIREQNPDSDFQPGVLHQLLLELPWADVFTTNYDTLLERTEIPGRNYQTVIKAEELPASFSPRIVKLHGSFPSQPPFIISEEDYRTYPRRFAPFVNTVQQALLENAFVLIGFSGDDPNFLAWTGWIRDELGESHAPIYLVGPHSLGTADRLLLERRGVTPIDLSPLFPTTPRSDVHRISIEWFLKCLTAAKPPRPDRWPEFSEMTVTLSSNLPPLVGVAEQIPEDVPVAPDPQKPFTNVDVVKVLKRWQFERQRYPGWIILPHQKRKPLLDDTKYWVGPLLRVSKDWPVAERLIVFREINWRFETAMVPLFPETIEPFEKAANEAFDLLSAGNLENTSHDLIPGIPGSGSIVITAWLELMFGLLREAREMYNEERWQKLRTQVNKVIPQHPEFEDQDKYESALWAVWNVNRKDAAAQIARWQPAPRSPVASLRKAGLLAELDELGESRTILRTALSDVRKALRAHGQNIQLLSLEGWITYLIFAVEQAKDFGRRWAIREEFWERWQELKAWDCSPWEEKDFFEQELSGDPPTIEPSEKETIGFDPGHMSISTHYSNRIEPFLPAFACVRFFEQAGIPFRMPRISLVGDALKNACNWIAPFIGLWSPALLVRTGNVDGVTKSSLFLTRTSIAAMPQEAALRLHSWCLNIFEREITSISSGIGYDSGQDSILRVLAEVISRLEFKVPQKDLRRSFSAALTFHNLPAVRSHISMHEASEPWFKRLFEAADDAVLLDWLPELLRAPLFDNVQKVDWRPEDATWPDPMDQFPGLRAANAKNGNLDTLKKVHAAVDWLLSRMPSEAGIAWRRGMLRLLNLSSNGLLTEQQDVALGKQVWARLGANGLPDFPNLAAVGYVMRFVAPSATDADSKMRHYVLSMNPAFASIGPNGQRVQGVSFGWRQPFLHEAIVVSKPIISFDGEPLRGIEWTATEADTLYQKARAWMESDKSLIQTEEQRKGDGFLMKGNAVLGEARRLDDFLKLAVLPWVQWSEKTAWENFFSWIEELRNLGVFVTSALPYALLHQSTEVNRCNEIIVTDLDSNNEDAISAAAEAVREWAHLQIKKGIPRIDPKAIQNLVRRIVFRKKEKIEYCISVLSHVVFETPELFSADQVELLIACMEPWKYATVLPASSDSLGEFAELRRPLLRRLLGELAGALKRCLEKRGETPSAHSPLSNWESLCAADPLPEVRRSFNKWDHFVR